MSGHGIFLPQNECPISIYIKKTFPRYRDSHVKDKIRSWDCLTLKMGIPVLVRRHLNIATAPWRLKSSQHTFWQIIRDCIIFKIIGRLLILILFSLPMVVNPHYSALISTIVNMFSIHHMVDDWLLGDTRAGLPQILRLLSIFEKLTLKSDM